MLKVCAKFETTLSSGISSSASTAVLVSNETNDGDGSVLPDGTYGFVIDEGNSYEEFVIATVSGTDLTFVSRGLAYYDGDTVKADNKKAHRKGASIKITDHPILARIIRVLNADDALDTNLKCAVAPASGPEYANKDYVDGVAIAGGANASDSIKGISKLSTAPASATNPIAVGDNDPRVPSQDENDALAGTSGTPGSSNKFVTADDVAENTNSKVVRRKSDGNITVPETPTADTDAASKKHVEEWQEGVKVGKTSAQAMSNVESYANITWDTEEYDDNNLHDNATNNHRITIQKAGRYLITANLIIEDEDGPVKAVVFKNSTKIGQMFLSYDSGGYNFTTDDNVGDSFSYIGEFAVGDYIYIIAGGRSNGSVGSISTKSSFSAQLIRK